MLPVVDQLARFTIAKRRGTSAKLSSGVDHEYSTSVLGQGGCGAEPGESTTNDNDEIRARRRRIGSVARRPHRAHLAASIVRAQVTAAITARCGRGIRTTREKTS